MSARLLVLVAVMLPPASWSCTRDAGTTAADAVDVVSQGDQGAGEIPDGAITDPGRDDAPFEPKPSVRNAPLFDESVIVRFDLEMDPADWDDIADPVKARSILDADQERWVRCSFRFDDQEFPQAACRRKGNPVDWDREPRPQLMIRFNKFVDKGRFLGLRRVNLEASIHYPAPVRDRIAMRLMRESGIQASRVNHARVKVNGQDMGLYMNIEHVDKEFVEDRFADSTGNLYKDGRELKTNEDIGDTSDLRNLRKLIEEADEEVELDVFFQALDAMMDVATAIRVMAGEAVLPTSSNFTNGYANFCLYNEPGRGFVLIPWDLDSLFGNRSHPEVDPFWHPASQDLENWRLKLRRLVNAHPVWRERFIDDLVQIRDGPYRSLGEYASSVCDQIRGEFESDPLRLKSVDDFDLDCNGIQERIDARIDFLKESLGR